MKFAVGRFAMEFGLWGLLVLVIGFFIIGFFLDRFVENEKIRNVILFGLGSVAAMVVCWYKDFLWFG